MGCLIHPAISVDKSKLRTADIATGTTVWILYVAKSLLEDCELLHGFDLSTEQFPATEQNALEPFPAKFLGYFDVIQVRLIILGLRGDDWDKAVENLAELPSLFPPPL
jgi:hypothetical protein